MVLPFYVIIREPREGLAVCRERVAPSFHSYFETLSIVPASGVDPAISRSAVKRFTDWANPAADKFHFAHESFRCMFTNLPISTLKILASSISFLAVLLGLL